MCGIAGWVSYDRDLTRHRADSRRDDGDHGLPRAGRRGHVAGRRTPRSGTAGWPSSTSRAARQPMVARRRTGGRWPCIIYSGEVYNFRELRAELTAPRPPLPHPQRHRGRAARPTWSGARRSPSASTACTPSRSGTPGARSSCWSATGWASSRSTTTRPPTGVLFGSEPKAILANPLARPRGRRRRAARAAHLHQDAGARGVPRDARGAARPRRHASTARGCAAPLLGARGPAAHRRPADHHRHRARAARGHRGAASSSPTCRCAPCSPAASTPAR